jgi:hypothetical protein
MVILGLISCFIRFVESLRTEMAVLDPRSQGRGAEVTESMDCLCFVQSVTEGVDVLINTSMMKPPITSAVAIGIGLCRVLHLDASLATTASLLLSSLHPADCQRVLTDLRVSSDGATLRETVRGSPGMPLSQMDRAMVELKPFRGYRLGEIVAYDANDAEVASEMCAEATCTSTARQPILCYGKVVFISDEGEAILKKISLRTGTATITLLPTAIYSFKSARDPTLHASEGATSQKRFSVTSKLMGVSGLKGPARNAKDGDTPTAAAASGGSDVLDHVDRESAGAVSRQEVLGALSSLLHRAGVPLSMEKQVSSHHKTMLDF